MRKTQDSTWDLRQGEAWYHGTYTEIRQSVPQTVRGDAMYNHCILHSVPQTMGLVTIAYFKPWGWYVPWWSAECSVPRTQSIGGGPMAQKPYSAAEAATEALYLPVVKDSGGDPMAQPSNRSSDARAFLSHASPTRPVLLRQDDGPPFCQDGRACTQPRFVKRYVTPRRPCRRRFPSQHVHDACLRLGPASLLHVVKRRPGGV